MQFIGRFKSKWLQKLAFAATSGHIHVLRVCAPHARTRALPVPSERREGESTPMGALDRPYEVAPKGTTYVGRAPKGRRTWNHVGGVRASLTSPSGRFGGFPLREPGARTREARGSIGKHIGRGSWMWPVQRQQQVQQIGGTQQMWAAS